MIELIKGYRIVLQNGDAGVVHEVFSNGYEFLMDSTGKYHHTDTEGYSGIGNAYDLNWDRTSDLNCGQECWNCKKFVSFVHRSAADGHCPHCEKEIELEEEDS